MKNILAIIFTIIIVGLMAYTLLNGRAFQGGEAANIIEDMKYIKDTSTQTIANEKEEQKNEGIETPADVQYVCKEYNLMKLGYKYTGKLLVAKGIIGLDYLWNKVRVQGGAYGCPMVITRAGNIGFASYRDPNLKETLEAYKKVENLRKEKQETCKIEPALTTSELTEAL